MKQLKFELKEKISDKANKLYLHVDYAGGDADTDHPETYLLHEIPFDEYEKHLEAISAEVDKYETLKQILGYGGHTMNYAEIKEEYGNEIADMFDNVPNDPQSDYQFKCYIEYIYLIGYDKEGNKYQSWV